MALPTLATLVDKARNADRVVGILDEAAKQYPELSVLPVRAVPSNSYTYVKRTALPTAGGFRSINDGVAPQTSTYDTVQIDLKPASQLVVVDQAVALAYPEGPAQYIFEESVASMNRFLFTILSQMLYGQTAAEASGFKGFLDYVDSSMEVDATGNGVSEKSRVFALYLEDPTGVHLVFKRDEANDILSIPDPTLQLVAGSTAGTYFQAYYTMIESFVGFQPGHKWQLGAIKNIDTSKPLTDALMSTLLAKFLANGIRPSAFIMSARSQSQLQQARVAYHPLGLPAPLPSEFEGIPIIVSPVVRDNE